MTDLYLASQSPRRRELLTQIGVKFELLHVDVPEEHQTGESADDYVQRLALSKATAGSLLRTDKPVLGADTIVVLGDTILEKPLSQEHAVEMLLALSGNTHQVMTAIALCHQGRQEIRLRKTVVRFRSINTAEALAYWHSGEPCDKAGAYGIQGLGAVFVEQIEGSYSAVVGLPLLETAELLAQFAVPVWQLSN